MEFEIDNGNAIYQIQTYKDGCITVSGQRYTASLIVLPDQLINPWGPNSFEDLKPEHFQMIIPYHPQVVLFGSGNRIRFPLPALYSVLMKERIGVEVMDTAAACRTYQILMSEGRRVAALLLC